MHRETNSNQPTNEEIVQLSEKLLKGKFCCVNTCLCFDSEIPMNLVTKTIKMTIDESFKALQKKWNENHLPSNIGKWGKFLLKTLHYQISKLDENNQYGYAIAKSMPTSSFRQMRNFKILYMFYWKPSI